MKQTKEIKLAYAAAFLDGEGCIRISKRNPRNGRSTSYNLLVMIAQKDGNVIDWFYGNFNGMVYLKNKAKENWIYEWRVAEKQAYKFLKQVLPFMKVKKKQAELAIRFHQRRIYARNRNNPDNGRFKSLSENELKIREEIYQEMSRLKKQYQKSKNPNVVEYNFKSMMQV